MFANLPEHRNDPIEAMFIRLMADTHPDKIDLGIGVFRDESGQAPVMESVRIAEQHLVDRKLPKSYVSPLGNTAYCSDLEILALGADHPVLKDDRVVSAQTPGAGSALRLGAELVRSLAPESRVWVSNPVWGHQVEFFEKAGLEICSYRYYDQLNSVSQFEQMIEDLQEMAPGDLLLVHGCCHNPTGHDLSIEQWQVLAELVAEQGVIPFVDVAYQGFGSGIEEDVAGVRAFADRVPQMLLTVSSSKSFGIYRERAGLISVILPPGSGDQKNLRNRLRDLARQLYFMPPDHGAALVHEILSTPDLETLWRNELDAVREHVVAMRAAAKRTIEAQIAGFDASFLVRQFGMFSCLPITYEEQMYLEKEYHIYMLPPARVNVAAMSSSQAVVLANAFNDVLQRRSKDVA